MARIENIGEITVGNPIVGSWAFSTQNCCWTLFLILSNLVAKKYYIFRRRRFLIVFFSAFNICDGNKWYQLKKGVRNRRNQNHCAWRVAGPQWSKNPIKWPFWYKNDFFANLWWNLFVVIYVMHSWPKKKTTSAYCIGMFTYTVPKQIVCKCPWSGTEKWLRETCWNRSKIFPYGWHFWLTRTSRKYILRTGSCFCCYYNVK